MHIGRRDKLALRVAAEGRIHSREQQRRRFCVGSLRRRRHLHHRRDQSRGNSVTRNIRNQQAHALRIRNQEVVKIPGDRRHRHILCSHPERFRGRELARQNRHLDAPRNLQLLLDLTQLLIARQRSPRRNISRDSPAEQHGEAIGLEASQPNKISPMVLSHIANATKTNKPRRSTTKS